jgi:hypothetical protein
MGGGWSWKAGWGLVGEMGVANCVGVASPFSAAEYGSFIVVDTHGDLGVYGNPGVLGAD